MVEAMHWNVADRIYSPVPDEVLYKMESIAEKLGFEMVVQHSKYCYCV